jgi:hypothetical protein
MYPHTVLTGGDVGILFMELWDHLGTQTLTGHTYTITGSGAGGGPYSGTVDSNGQLRQESVPFDDYTLTVDGAAETTVAAIVLANDATDPQVRFLDMGDDASTGPSSS